jgi:hypothetical protein
LDKPEANNTTGSVEEKGREGTRKTRGIRRTSRKLAGRRFPLAGSGLGEKFVFVNHCGYGQSIVNARTIHAHDFSLAAHLNAFGQRDLGRQGESEFNRDPASIEEST